MSTQVKLFGDNPKYERWRWQIFGITWLAYAGYYLTRKAFAVAKIPLAADTTIGLSREDMGLIDASYLIAYCAGQFFWGPLGDRLGPRKVVLIGMFLSIVSAFLSGLSNGIIFFLIFWIVQGLGQSTGWSALVKAMSSWFSVAERGRVMGWWCTNYAAGGLIALSFAGSMVALFGDWRYAYFMPALALGCVMLLFFLLQRNRPEDVGLPPIEQYHGEPESILAAGERPEEEPEGSWKVVAEVLRCPQVWVLAVAYFSMKLTRYAFLFWGPKYVNESLGTGVAGSSYISTLFEVGGVLGVLAAGYLSDKAFQSRRIPVSVISMILLGCVMYVAQEVPMTHVVAMCVFFFASGFFLFGPDALISGTAAMDFGTKKGAATAAGIINGVGSIGGALGGWLPGKFSTEADWSNVFTIFMIATFASVVILLPLWKAKPPSAS